MSCQLTNYDGYNLEDCCLSFTQAGTTPITIDLDDITSVGSTSSGNCKISFMGSAPIILADDDIVNIGWAGTPEEFKQAVLDAMKACKNNVETEVPEKIYLGKCPVKDLNNPKEIIIFYEWRITATGLPCFTDDLQGNNIVDINNYEMSNIASMPSEIKIEGIEKLNFVFCPTGGLTGGTLQDLLDAAIAEGALAPDASNAMVAPDAIAGYDLKSLYAKTDLKTKITTATGFTLGGDDDHYTNGGGVCQLPKPVDADCDGRADAAISEALQLTRPLEVEDGAGVQVCLYFYVADVDPTDPSIK